MELLCTEDFIGEMEEKEMSKEKTMANHQDLGGKKSASGGDTKLGGPRGNPICKVTQFGGERGNKRGHGFFKKEETPRFKLEQMFKLTEDELKEIVKDTKNASYAERKMATFILKGGWKDYREMIDEVYGYPKQAVETRDITPPPPLSPRKAKKKCSLKIQQPSQE